MNSFNLAYICRMKTALLLPLLFLLAACGGPEEKEDTASENDVDAARNFIRAALDGKWDKARSYKVEDSTNNALLQTAEDMYQQRGLQEKRGYREANITFYETRQLNDSIAMVEYANTYKKQRDTLKLVKLSGQWLVDLKYSLLPNDSTDGME